MRQGSIDIRIVSVPLGSKFITHCLFYNYRVVYLIIWLICTWREKQFKWDVGIHEQSLQDHLVQSRLISWVTPIGISYVIFMSKVYRDHLVQCHLISWVAPIDISQYLWFLWAKFTGPSRSVPSNFMDSSNWYLSMAAIFNDWQTTKWVLHMGDISVRVLGNEIHGPSSYPN